MRLAAWPFAVLVFFAVALLTTSTGGCSECAQHEQQIRVSAPDPELEALVTACYHGRDRKAPDDCQSGDRDCPCLPLCERLLALSRPTGENRSILECGSSFADGVRVLYEVCR